MTEIGAYWAGMIACAVFGRGAPQAFSNTEGCVGLVEQGQLWSREARPIPDRVDGAFFRGLFGAGILPWAVAIGSTVIRSFDIITTANSTKPSYGQVFSRAETFAAP